MSKIMPKVMTEVERVLEEMRVEKARKRNARKEYRKTEPILVLTEVEKDKMIENNKKACKEGKDDCMEWIKLMEMQKKSVERCQLSALSQQRM